MKQDVSQSILKLAEELLSKGYYVQKISRGETIDYLVISTAPPQNKKIIADSSELPSPPKP